MSTKPAKSSWVAFVLFYVVLVLIITILDWFNDVLTLSYWGAQIGLVTLGVGSLAVIGMWIQDLTAGNHLAQSGNVPVGFDYSATIDSQTNATIRHRIELYDNKPGPFVSGSQWTLSVWANNQIRARVQDSNANTSLAMGDMTATSETSNGFTRYAETFTLSANASGDYLEVALQNQNGVLMRVTGCQLEAGPVATPFEQRPYGLELSLCQRYFFKGDTIASFTADPPGTSFYAFDHFPATMRATPTIANVVSGAVTPTTNPTPNMCRFKIASATAASVTAYDADAEL